MSWLVTSPYGRQLTASWSCSQCRSGHSPDQRTADEIRAEAAAHVANRGHQVTVYSGTSELLLPLATADPRTSHPGS